MRELSQSQRITVRKLLYGGREVIRWEGRLLERTDSYVLIEAAFSMASRDLGYMFLEKGDLFFEFYYFREWFNIFQIYSSQGLLKGWYCNVCTPATLEDSLIAFTDLTLDVFVQPSGEAIVLDEEDFQREKETLYPPEVAARAERAVQALVSMARHGQLPSVPFGGASHDRTTRS